MKNSTTPIIATSRRTGKGFEEVLKSSLGDLACKSSLWYHHQSGRRSLKSLMMEADIIYVTGDSAMMHAEAISTGLPVISILPATVKPEDKLEQQLKKYEREGFIQRRFFGECLDYETSKSSRLKVQEVQKLFAETLISKLME